MSFIDCSDPEGMFDLFSEFLRDEINDSSRDPQRQQFLRILLKNIHSASELDVSHAIERLRAIGNSLDAEFKTDPAFFHLMDLMNELERIV